MEGVLVERELLGVRGGGQKEAAESHRSRSVEGVMVERELRGGRRGKGSKREQQEAIEVAVWKGS